MSETRNGTVNHVRSLIETGARMDPAFYTSESRPQSDEVQTSIAISLKRIADRLEGISTLFGDGSMGQLNVGADVNANVSLNG